MKEDQEGLLLEELLIWDSTQPFLPHFQAFWSLQGQAGGAARIPSKYQVHWLDMLSHRWIHFIFRIRCFQLWVWGISYYWLAENLLKVKGSLPCNWTACYIFSFLLSFIWEIKHAVCTCPPYLVCFSYICVCEEILAPDTLHSHFLCFPSSAQTHFPLPALSVSCSSPWDFADTNSKVSVELNPGVLLSACVFFLSLLLFPAGFSFSNNVVLLPLFLLLCCYSGRQGGR